MKNLDCYSDHAPKMEWFESFFQLGESYFELHSLGNRMIVFFRRFLIDAGLIEANTWTPLAYLIRRLSLYEESSWGLMLVNLSYTPEVSWYIQNIEPWVSYSRDQLMTMLSNEGVNARGSHSIVGAYRRILQLPFGEKVGLGKVTGERAKLSFMRTCWFNPDPRVILFALYKYAEACDGFYQFTFAHLMNFDIESEGISPAQIFGLERDTMEKLLTGLSVQYPDFINATFTPDLDNINLRDDKTSADVLELF